MIVSLIFQPAPMASLAPSVDSTAPTVTTGVHATERQGSVRKAVPRDSWETAVIKVGLQFEG